MEDCNEVTYYEYWLKKEVWPAYFALIMIFDYYKFGRLFDDGDNYEQIRASFMVELVNKMGHTDAKTIFSKRSFGLNKYDDGDWVEGKLVIQDSDVKPKEYISWLHGHGYELPYEFKIFIGLEEKVEDINEKRQQKIDKAVCQGIGRTLWELHPDMTIEDMQYHKAIQVYGSGKLYSTDTTLRRWLSEVDPRTNKTGPKKT